MVYQHTVNGTVVDLPLGKVVCVGRNYADHAAELNNPVPKSPILFLKPASAVVPFSEPIVVPCGMGECHHELEMALLIGRKLEKASEAQCLDAVAGYGLALDLTLRELQSQLKEKGHPWERAKAFDGACPLSGFVAAEQVRDWRQCELSLTRNAKLQQQGCCADMLFPVEALLAEISQSFSLMPGDVVLTGTPAGVGPLQPGDEIAAAVNCEGHRLITVETHVL